MAKAGTVAEPHPEVAAETEAAADIAAGELVAGEAAGEAAAAPRRQQAAGVVQSQQPCAHWEGLHLVVGNDL